MNFYHRFIPHHATILSPLNALLKSTATNSHSLQWTTTATSAFEEIKDALAKTTLLVHPKSDAPINVMTDASDVAIEAVLQQYLDGKWCPLSYFSCKLSPTEQRSSTFDQELLAVYCVIRHFRHFLEARQFYVLTDHKPLTHSLKSKPDRHSLWQVRHLDFISQFTSDIRHVTVQDNPVGDALSRLGANAIHSDTSLVSPTVDFQAMASAQPDASTLQKLQVTNSNLRFSKVTMPMCKDLLLCETSSGTPRPFVLEHFRNIVFNSLHFLSHPGIRATQRLVTSRFFWPGMNADVRRWARSCLQCQGAKVHRHTTTPLGTFNTQDVRFDHVHIDLVGPLPTSQGCTYLLTSVDRFTRWPEAIPIPDSTAATVAQAFINGWVSRFGVPSTITTDRGQQFESTLWKHLMQLLGTHRIRTTAYHPSANGLVERFHRQLKGAIKCLPDTNQWTKALPLILLGIRTTIKQNCHCKVAELVYGPTLGLPGEFFNPSSTTQDQLDPQSYASQLKTMMQKLQPPVVRKHTQRTMHIHTDLSSYPFVFVRHDGVRTTLQPPYDGPYKVLQRNNKHYTLEISGKQKVVSLDRLKPAYIEDTSTNTSLQTFTAILPPSTPPNSTTCVTRSGHQVHWPRKLAN